jgi:hypothetical protein
MVQPSRPHVRPFAIDEESIVRLDTLHHGRADQRLSRCSEPIRIGLPFPKAGFLGPKTATLRCAKGQRIPLQLRVLDRWPDTSIRWALLDFTMSTDSETPPICFLHLNDRSADDRDPGFSRIQIENSERGRRFLVDTGAAQFRFSVGGPLPFSDVVVDGHSVITTDHASLSIEDREGVRNSVKIAEVAVLDNGPLRVTVLLKGTVRSARLALLEVECTLEFFAQSATVRCAVTVRNSGRAKHPRGIWVLGDAGSLYLRDVSLRIGVPSPATIHCSPEPGTELDEWPAPFELYQDSSGGEHWQSHNHFNRDHVIPLTFRGYRLRAGGQERSGHRATPIVSLRHGAGELTFAMCCFWQNFPKSVEAMHDSFTLRLFPRQHADLHELQGGEQKTHVFVLAFRRDSVTDLPLEWVRDPLLVRARPEWYAAASAIPYLVPKFADPHPHYRELIDAAIEGSDTFCHKRETADEYGWRNFGDLYGDHEAVRSSMPAPLVSHYNNQYDALAGFARQFMGTGDRRWWSQFDELAKHVVDIDIYHTSRDRAAYNHGMFWHTVHYIDADTSTHRSYPNLPGVHGGGPSSEHNYTTGLMLHYLLTGDARSRQAVLGLAQFVIDRDDGRKSRWRWIDRGRTGQATGSGSRFYHGPGRASANSLNALLDAHRLTGEPRFLAKGDEIIRRCVNPADDVAARRLLDAERKWFYTMFFQALGKYLDYKTELGQRDEHYAYAQASLLHYAAWMADHEYPYLEKPEILEFPTETWAAQDIRKSDVFNFAACHSTDSCQRGRFRERAKFFFDYSTRTLREMPTHSLARPIVVLLNSGFIESHIDLHGASAPRPDREIHDFAAPSAFVPQDVRVRRRLAAIAALLAAMGLGSVAYALMR